MWHFEDLRFVDSVFLGFADLKLQQVCIFYTYFFSLLLKHIMFLFKFVLFKESFKKTTVWTVLKQNCAVFFTDYAYKFADLRFAAHLNHLRICNS
jgi:hypothetical protein